MNEMTCHCKANKPIEWTGRHQLFSLLQALCLPLMGSVRRTQSMGVYGVLMRGHQVFVLTPNAEHLCGST
jgi:hypothetical protein